MTPTIICHRGFWTRPEEQNTLAAFARAFDAGFGVELDVRDFAETLLVSHDPPSRNILNGIPVGSCRFSEVLDLLGDRPNFLAVNVKSCGLAPLFAAVERKPKNWFFFDIAVADEYGYSEANDGDVCLPIYGRIGQGMPPRDHFDSHYYGTLIDVVFEDWFPTTLPLLPFCFVSPELHYPEAKKSVKRLWDNIKYLTVPCSLCTDRPAEAMEFFK